MDEHQIDPARRKRRLLVVDDNEAMHEDVHKVLAHHSTVLDDMEAQLFGDEPATEQPAIYEIDSALQGQEGFELVRKAQLEGRPYELAFVDLRMPPGWDGLETISKIWQVDPLLQIILCAAFLGQSQQDITRELGRAEGLAIIQKPFDSAQILKLARSMTDQCHAARSRPH